MLPSCLPVAFQDLGVSPPMHPSDFSPPTPPLYYSSCPGPLFFLPNSPNIPKCHLPLRIHISQ